MTQQQWLLNSQIFSQTAMPTRPTHNYSGRGKSGVILRHMQFLYDMGTSAITVENAGIFLDSKGVVRRKPVCIFCDPLSQDAGGLAPTSGIIYDAAQMLTSFIVQNDMLLAVVADAHVDDVHVNTGALTEIAIYADYYLQLTADEQRLADTYFVSKMEIPSLAIREADIRRANNPNAKPIEKLKGQRWTRYQQQGVQMPDDGQEAQKLTVNEVIILLGNSPDGEFKEFLFNFKHCVEPVENGGKGLFKWIPFVQDVFEQVMRANKVAREAGETAPNNRVVSFHKNDLRPAVSNGLRGTEGNLLEEFMMASQFGMPTGGNHDYDRQILIYGMGTPYTVMYAVLNALALGFRVTLQMTSTFNFDPAGISMLELVRMLRHMFPNAFRATFYWDAELMGGPEPVARNGKTYNQVAAEVVTMLNDHLASTGGAGLNMSFYGFGDPNDLQPVVADESL